MGHAQGEMSTSQRGAQNSGFNTTFSYVEERKDVGGASYGQVMGKLCKQREVSYADLSRVFSTSVRVLTCRQPSLPAQEGRYPL